MGKYVILNTATGNNCWNPDTEPKPD